MAVQARVQSQDGKSVGDLVRQFSEQTSHLIRDEMRLAQAELQQKAKHAGTGLGLFSGAGLLAFFGVAALITSGIAAFALVLPVWTAALIVAGILFVVAAVAGLIGRSQVRQAAPRPEHTIMSVKRDVEELKESRH